MSANSSMTALWESSEVCHQLVEWVSERGAHLAGQMGVDGGGAGRAMTEVFLDQAQVDARFQQVGSVRMAQGVHVSALVDATVLPGTVESALHAAAGNGATVMGQTVCQAVARGSGKQPKWRAMGAPVSTQQLQSRLGQGHIAVLFSFAMDVQEHAGTIDVGHLEVSAFL